MRIDGNNRGPREGDGIEGGPSGPLGRLRLALAAWEPAARRRMAAVAVGAVALAIFLLATSGRERETTFWLENGRAFSSDEARALVQALTEKGIASESGPRGQLGVPAASAPEAIKLLGQKGLSRRSLDELVDEPEQPSFFADPEERKQVYLRQRGKQVEALLEGFDGVLGATVLLIEPRGRRYGQSTGLKATVILSPSEPGSITADLVGKVETNLLALVPELVRGRDITVLDETGRAYLEAGDPSVALRTRAGAQALEWERALARRLSPFIHGIRVSIRMEWPDAPTPAAAAPASAPIPEAMAVVPNAPVSLPEPAPEPPAPAGPGLANVLVEIPSQHFLDRFRAVVGADRIPTQAELQPFIGQTSEQVEKAVRHEIPEASLGGLQIAKLPLPAPRTIAPKSRGRSAWDTRSQAVAGAAAGAGVLFLVLVATGGRRLARGRRSGPPGDQPRVRFDEEDRPGPADRVRELVRRDPEAAAGVLRRWVGQGGTP